MPVKPKPKERPHFRVVDLGPGEGEKIKKWINADRPHRVIEGVDSEKHTMQKIMDAYVEMMKGRLDSATIKKIKSMYSEKLKIDGIKITHKGFDEWIKNAKRNSRHVINADFFFDFWIQNKWGHLSVQKQQRRMLGRLKQLREILVPNGRLYVTCKQHQLEFQIWALEQAGFTSIEHRPLMAGKNEEETKANLQKELWKKGEEEVLRTGIGEFDTRHKITFALEAYLSGITKKTPVRIVARRATEEKRVFHVDAKGEVVKETKKASLKEKKAEGMAVVTRGNEYIADSGFIIPLKKK